MDVLALESDLLAVRAALAARRTLDTGVPERGAVAMFDVAVWDGRNASADLLACSFEPGSVLAPGVHELVRTGRCGGHDLTVGTWVVVGADDQELPTPARVLSWRPDTARRPVPDPVDEPTELAWLDTMARVVRLDVQPRVVLERRLRRLVGRGDAALARLVAQFSPMVGRTVASRRAVIDRNPAFGTDDARACVTAELVDQLLRFASADRPSATVLRTLRFALPNRLDAALGTVDRAHTGSAEKAEIRLFVRNHPDLDAMPDAHRADAAELERHFKALASRLGMTDPVRALEAVRHAEDVQWSISITRARRAAASRGEHLARDWAPGRHRYTVPHICEALAHQVTLLSLDRPTTGDGEGDEGNALHELVAAAPESGFALVEDHAVVTSLLSPADGFSVEAAVLVLARQGHDYDEIARRLELSDPERAVELAARELVDGVPAALAREVEAVLAGVDLTDLEREVFVMRSGLGGDVGAWSDICDRTGLAQRYRSKTAAETRARNVLRRAERLVRGRGAMVLDQPPARRAELLHDRALALTERPFALAN